MKSVLLIGLGKFGKHIAIQLNQRGYQVMGVDINEERVNECIRYLTDAQIGDSTNEEFLSALGVGNYDICFVTIGNDFQSSLETTSLLKEMGAALVVSRAACDTQAKFLLRNGADEILYPEKQLASWAAIKYGSRNLLGYIEIDEENSIFEVPVPQAWLGRSIGGLDIRKKYNINIIAIKRDGKITGSVVPETILTNDITLLVMGNYKYVQKCFHL